jgi:hypothetical protein
VRSGNKYDYKYETCKSNDKGHQFEYNESNKTIKNMESNLCLAVESNGKDITQKSCTDNNAKNNFRLDSDHRIYNDDFKKCLGDDTSQSNTLILQDCMESNQNYWFV